MGHGELAGRNHEVTNQDAQQISGKGFPGWEKSNPSVSTPWGSLRGSVAEPVAVLSRVLARDDASPTASASVPSIQASNS